MISSSHSAACCSWSRPEACDGTRCSRVTGTPSSAESAGATLTASRQDRGVLDGEQQPLDLGEALPPEDAHVAGGVLQDVEQDDLAELPGPPLFPQGAHENEVALLLPCGLEDAVGHAVGDLDEPVEVRVPLGGDLLRQPEKRPRFVQVARIPAKGDVRGDLDDRHGRHLPLVVLREGAGEFHQGAHLFLVERDDDHPVILSGGFRLGEGQHRKGLLLGLRRVQLVDGEPDDDPPHRREPRPGAVDEHVPGDEDLGRDPEDGDQGDQGNPEPPLQVRVGLPHPDQGHVHLQEDEEEHDVRGARHVLDREGHRHQDDDGGRGEDRRVRCLFDRVDLPEEGGKVVVPGHREGDAGGGVDRRVQGARGGEQAADQEHDAAAREELPGRLHDRQLLHLPEELPGRGRPAPDAADGDEGDQQVDGDHDQQREEDRPRDVPPRGSPPPRCTGR